MRLTETLLMAYNTQALEMLAYNVNTSLQFRLIWYVQKEE